MKKTLLLAILSTLLSGCTTQWVPASSNPAPFSQAKAECSAESMQQFPVKNEVAQRSQLRTVRQPCMKDVQCGKDNYYDQNIPMTESYVIDVNRDSRNQYYYSCMQQKGWKQETKYLL
ncbi:hypothetical protein FE394_12810 [Xenorhabdus sp. Reich]|uniref:Lipoprotein n=1 Tax=Xenorhabdus littoralis TaxID=2582835 RepID=A0ABU4SN26_9GAMM|nr:MULTISPECIES: hypothetical protein [unclassified Xenorhabdus]MDX7992414.1 hypothetical protein [Xenorhabdus sp. psl]MDX8000061.1 hypothetical protein [Xenorhabdus sp. Reich]